MVSQQRIYERHVTFFNDAFQNAKDKIFTINVKSFSGYGAWEFPNCKLVNTNSYDVLKIHFKEERLMRIALVSEAEKIGAEIEFVEYGLIIQGGNKIKRTETEDKISYEIKNETWFVSIDVAK
jgi:hypothetical protein